MSDLLKIGTTILSEGVPYKIVDELGSGGQGTVYKVSDESSLYALKWYNRQSSTPEQYRAIEALIEKGAPNERFVWPIAMAEGNTSENFGYLMPLVDVKRFTKLSHYFGSEMGVRRYEPIITACIQMAHSFYDLHLSGLCYRDISFGNIFIDFNTGDVQICDNDNVAFDNLTESEENWGTQGFMAPEIILGEKPPSSLSDLFSLSVVLFRMLHFQHPLQGKREYEIEIADFEALMDLYGKHPVFIYDQHDDSNRPVKGKKDMADYFWPFYPESIRSRFVEAFTVGLTNPELRVRESIWIKELALLKSALMYCYSCGNQVFYRRECLNGNFTCPHCHKEIGYLPPRLKVGNRILLLNHDTVLYENQIFESNLMDYDKKFLKVEVHPVHEKFWGIRNLTETAWRVVGNEGNEKLIKTDEVLTMVEGLNIDFGTALGSIKLGTNRRKPQ